MFTLNIKSKCYTYYKYGLIDTYYDLYEMSTLFNCHKGKLYYGNEGIAQSTNNQRLRKHKIVCNITPMKDSFQLNFEGNEILNEDEYIWLSLQHSYDIKKGYRIHKRDVIKFGSVIFNVFEIGDNSCNINEALLDLSSLDLAKSHEYNENNQLNLHLILNNPSSNQNSTKSACRICFEDKSSPKNPLITPCDCKGTMQFIHLECVRKMIKMEVIKRSNTVIFYVFTSLFCDLCKIKYTKEISHSSQTYSLFSFEKPQNNYIIFKHSLKNKEIFVVVNLEEGNSIAIGKTPLVDIPFPDFSMSYVQAMVSYSKGHYYLTDLRSKYGTYIKLTKQFNVLPFHKITLQMNHYFFTFSMKKKLCAYLKCYFPKNLAFKSYNDYFGYLAKEKEHHGTRYFCKTLSHKKLVIKSILKSRTPSLLIKKGTQFKTFVNKTNNSFLPSELLNR